MRTCATFLNPRRQVRTDLNSLSGVASDTENAGSIRPVDMYLFGGQDGRLLRGRHADPTIDFSYENSCKRSANGVHGDGLAQNDVRKARSLPRWYPAWDAPKLRFHTLPIYRNIAQNAPLFKQKHLNSCRRCAVGGRVQVAEARQAERATEGGECMGEWLFAPTHTAAAGAQRIFLGEVGGVDEGLGGVVWWGRRWDETTRNGCVAGRWACGPQVWGGRWRPIIIRLLTSCVAWRQARRLGRFGARRRCGGR
jgi:hypothetical protein